MVYKIHLSGLTCQACQKVTENRFKKMSGVADVNVKLESQIAEVATDRKIEELEFKEALKGTGYTIISIS